MTTVVACAIGDSICMAADTCTNVYERPIVDGARKILRLPTGDGDVVLLGFAGAGGLPGCVAAGLKVDATPRDDDDPQQWALAVAVAVTDLATDRGLVEDGKLDGSLLLGWRGRLWTVVHAMAIPHPDGRAALGSGEGPAIGALDALLLMGASGLDAVRIAAEVACRRDRYSMPPIQTELLAPRRRPAADGSKESVVPVEGRTPN